GRRGWWKNSLCLFDHFTDAVDGGGRGGPVAGAEAGVDESVAQAPGDAHDSAAFDEFPDHPRGGVHGDDVTTRDEEVLASGQVHDHSPVGDDEFTGGADAQAVHGDALERVAGL